MTNVRCRFCLAWIRPGRLGWVHAHNGMNRCKNLATCAIPAPARWFR